MPMLTFSIFLPLLLFINVVFSMCLLNSAKSLILSFLLLVGFSICWAFHFFHSTPALLLYLVYIGGLLVLLIYIVIVSSNTYNEPLNVPYLLCLTFSLSVLIYLCLDASRLNNILLLKTTSDDVPINFSILFVIGIVLLFIFVNICTLLRGNGNVNLNGNI